MGAKFSLLSSPAANSGPKPPSPSDAAGATEKVKMERLLHEMTKFGQEQEAKAGASTAALHPDLSAIGKSVRTYQLPVDLQQISSSLKMDDPPTPMRIGQLSTFIQKVNPFTKTMDWIGLTWAEIFFPVSGERPRSIVGRKAYEVVLKQSFEDGGKIVRENVVTTGRVIGVVIAELPHETVSVLIEDWFVESDAFKKGYWDHRDLTSPAI